MMQAMKAWNTATPELLNIMIADEVFGWTGFQNIGPHNALCGRNPDGHFVPVPDYMAPDKADGFRILEVLTKRLKDAGHDPKISVVSADNNKGFEGQLALNATEWVEHDIKGREVVTVWGDTITEVLCFLGLYAVTNLI